MVWRLPSYPSEAARSASTKGSLVAPAFVVGFVNPQEKVNGLGLVVAAACIYVLAGDWRR
jgi:hypothetical protein